MKESTILTEVIIYQSFYIKKTDLCYIYYRIHFGVPPGLEGKENSPMEGR